MCIHVKRFFSKVFSYNILNMSDKKKNPEKILRARNFSFCEKELSIKFASKNSHILENKQYNWYSKKIKRFIG